MQPILTSLRRGRARAAISNLFWLATERGLQTVAAIIISGALARYFGPIPFGQWQYALSLLQVVSPLTWVCGAELLVPVIVTTLSQSATAEREVITHPLPKPPLAAILGTAFALRMVVAMLAFAVVIVLVIWNSHYRHTLDPVLGAMFIGLCLTLLFREPFAVVTAWLQARTYSRPALIISASAVLAKTLMIVAMVHFLVAPRHFGLAWGAESAAIAVGLMFHYRHYAAQHRTTRQPFRWRIDSALLRRFIIDGWVFWLGLIGMYAFLKLDRLMLKDVVGYAELGRYAAAQQINENAMSLALMLAQTVAPAFIYGVDQMQSLRRALLRLVLLTVLIMSTGAAILSVFATPIVHLVFGDGFSASASILRWSAWLAVPAGIEAICNLVVLKYQAKYVVLAKWAVALACAFVANHFLIPAYHGYGALGGILVGYLIAIAIDLAFIWQRWHHAPAASASISERTP